VKKWCGFGERRGISELSRKIPGGNVLPDDLLRISGNEMRCKVQ
jgi:hypothetical protein